MSTTKHVLAWNLSGWWGSTPQHLSRWFRGSCCVLEVSSPPPKPSAGEDGWNSTLKGSSEHITTPLPVFLHHWLHEPAALVHPKLSPALLQRLLSLMDTAERKKIRVIFWGKIQQGRESFLPCNAPRDHHSCSPHMYFLSFECSPVDDHHIEGFSYMPTNITYFTWKLKRKIKKLKIRP